VRAGRADAGGGLTSGRGWLMGNLQAYDAKSGEVVWQFQTGVSGGGPGLTEL